MTTWRSPRLVVGEFGLPWPAVLVAPWQLTARFDQPADLALQPVSRPEDWDMLLPHPSASLSLAPDTGLVLHLGPGSLAPLYLDETRESGWDETVQAMGRAIVATTDLGVLLAQDPNGPRNIAVRRRLPARQPSDAGRDDAGQR